MAPGAVLYEEIDVFLVLKISIERGDVPMGKVELHTEFSRNLPLVLLVADLFLLHDLHPAQETCLLVLD